MVRIHGALALRQLGAADRRALPVHPYAVWRVRNNKVNASFRQLSQDITCVSVIKDPNSLPQGFTDGLSLYSRSASVNSLKIFFFGIELLVRLLCDSADFLLALGELCPELCFLESPVTLEGCGLRLFLNEFREFIKPLGKLKVNRDGSASSIEFLCCLFDSVSSLLSKGGTFRPVPCLLSLVQFPECDDFFLPLKVLPPDVLLEFDLTLGDGIEFLQPPIWDLSPAEMLRG